MALLDKKTIQIGDSLLLDVVPGEEFIQVRVLDGKGHEHKTMVRRVDLYAATFAIADAKTQEELLPVRKTEMMTFERIHNVRLKKDMKANQIMKVKCHVDVPLRIEENLKGLLRDPGQVSPLLG